MSETMTMWIEIAFNVAYLGVIWGLIVAMIRREDDVPLADRPVARRIRWAFTFLALGDVGHVGFRVVAYALGDLETTFSLFGQQVGLVGLGALSTAITVTLFYVLMLDTWRVRYDRQYRPLEYLLLAVAALRLLLLIPAANQWSSIVPPQPWSLYRNLPLTILGLGVAYLILRDARQASDRPFIWIGVSILVSYACYLPVILFVQQVPAVGMLMIPKTLAYVAIAFIAYFSLYRQPAAARQPAPSL